MNGSFFTRRVAATGRVFFDMKPYRNKKYLDDAKDRPCVACGVKDGTVVAAHVAVPGLSGKSQKMMDVAVADLCATCHDKMDGRQQPSWQNDYEHKMRLMLKTLARRLAEGWRLEQ